MTLDYIRAHYVPIMPLLQCGGLLKGSHRGSQEIIDQLLWILQDLLGALAERRKFSFFFFEVRMFSAG